MSVLNREEFFERLSNHIGDSTTDDSISFMEDMTDTYNSLTQKGEEDVTYWKNKCEKLDESWKAKYKHRFFSGGSNNFSDMKDNDGSSNDETEKITIENLFK